jgi:hypothetical protein
MSGGGLAAANIEVTEAHTRRIVGPTILMGDGSYFDFESPHTTEMTLADYAWALAGTNRFRCQTRRADKIGWPRCFYNVAQHCVLIYRQMRDDDCDPADCFAGLMHESDEVPWGDPPGPAKPLVPGFKPIAKTWGEGIDRHFNVVTRDPALIKKYDLRMLATEKRDLMPHGRGDAWQWIAGYEPFGFQIRPWSGEEAAENFILAHGFARAALSKAQPQ